MPAAGGEMADRLEDLSRDLQNVAAGAPMASDEFADDLLIFADVEEMLEATEVLARLVTDALTGMDLSAERSAQLAHALWVVMAAQELSESQMNATRDEFRLDLIATGASEAVADAVSAQLAITQQFVSTRSRRWYEVF
jgi:hypothetical protein